MTIRFDGRISDRDQERAIVLDARMRWRWRAAAPRSWSTTSAGSRRPGSLTPAEAVVEEVRRSGGMAMADGADVSNFEQVEAVVAPRHGASGATSICSAPMPASCATESFANIEVADFPKVLDVRLQRHLLLLQGGARQYARARLRPHRRHHLVVGAVRRFRPGQVQVRAQTGMVGLMNVLARRRPQDDHPRQYGVADRATRMTEELLPPQALELMKPEAISPAVVFLLSEDAPTRTIMGAGAGSFAVR